MNAPDRIALHESPLAHVRGGLDLCVHCGFCLQACPTYLALENESDSPRGRIVLMHALLEGDIAPSDAALHTHISRCLGCRGCETACPSGVPFGHLLEATRATLREHHPTPIVARMLLALFARPTLLAIVMAPGRWLRSMGIAHLLGRMRGRIGNMFAMLAATAPGRLTRAGIPAKLVPAGGKHAPADSKPGPGAGIPPGEPENIALFEGCVMRELYGHVHAATRSVLSKNDFALVPATGQRCCGALHAHAGDAEKARELARANIAAFEQSPAERIAVNAAGCGAMLKEYQLLLADDPQWAARATAFSAKVRDITELLAEKGPVTGNPVALTVAYDAPCHLQHAQRVVAQPLALFSAIPGLRLVQLPDSDQCCGAAGIYNIVEPDTSSAVLAPKLAALRAAGIDAVCTGNPGCMMQIGTGIVREGDRIEVLHPVELLDYSYRTSIPP